MTWRAVAPVSTVIINAPSNAYGQRRSSSNIIVLWPGTSTNTVARRADIRPSMIAQLYPKESEPKHGGIKLVRASARRAPRARHVHRAAYTWVTVRCAPAPGAASSSELERERSDPAVGWAPASFA